MQNQLKIKILTIFAIAFLSACGTVTPDAIKDDVATFDSSTPEEYSAYNSGFIKFLEDKNGEPTHAVLTKHKIENYNNLITAYRSQFFESEKVLLNINDGIADYEKDLYKMDIEHFKYFLKLNRWKKELREDDSVWKKIKFKFITPEEQ